MFNFQWLYQIYKTTFLFVVVAASLVVSQASVLLITSYQLFSSTRKLAQPGILVATLRSQYLVPQLSSSKHEVKLKIIDRLILISQSLAIFLDRSPQKFINGP